MVRLRPATGDSLRLSRVFGAGGIGSGVFFRLEGARTLGRNESRPALLMPWKDYCKQHIILHYLSVLLGAGEGIKVHPIGRVGADNAGTSLLNEMKAAGMDTSAVAVDAGRGTLFSVCFQYPDSSGGNITSSNSASGAVSAGDVNAFFSAFPEPDGRELMLAAPEVPLEARLALLEQGSLRGGFCAASVLAQEAGDFLRSGGAERTGLLSVNIDEARALAGRGGRKSSAPDAAAACYGRLRRRNPGIRLIVSSGPDGCYACDNGRIAHIMAPRVDAVSTAGAGDALLAGTLAGLACGLEFMKGREDGRFAETPLDSAVELGTLLASFSVTSPHTIHPGADAESLGEWARANAIAFTRGFTRMFADAVPD